MIIGEPKHVKDKKICLIGLDGVGLDILRAFFNSLILNNIAHVINKGFSESFISVPPYTPCAWTSIFTGVNPGKHGIYGFYKVSKSAAFSISFTTSYHVMYPRIFEMSSIFNRRSIIVNIPLTYPYYALAGLKNLIVISDWAAPKQFIYPRRYEKKYWEYLIEPPHRWWKNNADNIEDYVKKVEEFITTRLNLYHELLEEENFDLFVIVFSELDWLMHKIPDLVIGKKLHYVYKVLASIDKFIGNATKACDIIVIISDHGFMVARIFIGINKVLADKGFLAYKYKLNVNKILHRSQRVHVLSKYGRKDRLSHIRSLILGRIFTVLGSLVSPYILKRLESLAPLSIDIDYSNTIAFMNEPATWGVYVKNGWLDAVKKVFAKNVFIKGVLAKEDVFWGPYTSLAPDLILIPKDNVFFDTRVYSEHVYTDYVGEHEPHAFVALYGDDIVSDKHVNLHVNMYDIVPTVLAYLGLPIPHNTDGKVLGEIIPSLPKRIKKFNYLQRFKILRKIKAKSMIS